MTQQQLESKAKQEINNAKSLRIKVFKFDKGEMHPTIAASYNRERLAILYKLNELERFARVQYGIKIPNLHWAKQTLWSLLCSIKHRMSEL